MKDNFPEQLTRQPLLGALRPRPVKLPRVGGRRREHRLPPSLDSVEIHEHRGRAVPPPVDVHRVAEEVVVGVVLLAVLVAQNLQCLAVLCNGKTRELV
jgi:hypothetical protein